MTEPTKTPSVPIEPARLAQAQAALLRPMGVKGVFARTGLYEAVQAALGVLITAWGPAAAEVLRFPPVMSRAQIQTSGYPSSFSHYLGCVSCLGEGGADVEASVPALIAGAEDWGGAYGVADLVLTPASCYPVYPIAAARGPVAAQGWTFDVGCDCFRREPSDNLDRLQSFRMREFVHMGSPEQVLDFREHWMAAGLALAGDLGLPAQMDLANDLFLGPGSKFMAASQRGQSLKFELLIPVISNDKPTACMSFNYHKDHFGGAWDLKLQDGKVAHTACVAFGMDRLTMALFIHHGLDPKTWPEALRARLQL